jgi:membrane-associated phospholipid phosphatase
MRLPVPLIHREKRVAGLVICAAILITLYQLPVRLQIRPTISLDQSFVDAWIPFLQGTIWIYLSEYLLLVLAVWLPVSDVERSHAFYGLVLASVLGLAVFTLWPTAVATQSPSFAGPTGLLWRWLYLVDTPANALPSLHAANTCIAGLCLFRSGRPWRLAAPVWGALILVSTLTTKQHYAIDIAGGIALAILCIFLVRACLRLH